MYRLSLIISEVYNKYLPLAEKGGISLNLDFSDTTKTVANPITIKEELDKHLSSALSRSERGEIGISVEQDAIVITDSGTIISKPICTLLSKGRVSVSSRVGFGTTVRISLQPSEPALEPTAKLPASATSTKKPLTNTKPLTTKSQATTKSAAKSSLKPTVSVKAKTKAKTKATPRAKLTREQRQLASAAKKANRKIQKLRQFQQKTQPKVQSNARQKSQQSAKTPKAKSTKSKPTKKTRKHIIELS